MYMVMNLCFTQTLQEYTLADLNDTEMLENLAGELRKRIQSQEKIRQERSRNGQGGAPVRIRKPQPEPPSNLRRN